MQVHWTPLDLNHHLKIPLDRAVMLRSLVIVAALAPAHGFVVPSTLASVGVSNLEGAGLRMSTAGPSNRAQFLQSAGTTVGVATSALAMLPSISAAEEATTNGEVEQVALTTTKLGGQLEPFADVTKGYRLAKPLGWNRYDGVSGEYVVKMVDLVDPTQVILLTSSPVKSETQLSTMGSLQKVGEKLSKGRNMEMIAARERITEGVRLYDFEFKDGNRRELKTLTVNKNKLWNLTLGCPDKSWTKREETYRTIVSSFLPRL